LRPEGHDDEWEEEIETQCSEDVRAEEGERGVGIGQRNGSLAADLGAVEFDVFGVRKHLASLHNCGGKKNERYCENDG